MVSVYKCVGIVLGVVLLSTYDVGAYATVYVENRQVLVDSNESVLALDQSSADGNLHVYTRSGKLQLPVQDGNSSLTLLDGAVTDIASDSTIGTVTVNYFSRCVTIVTSAGAMSSVGDCSGQKGTVTKLDINPFGVATGPNHMIAFTDEFNHTVKQWNTLTGEITTLTSDTNLIRPRGLVYDSTRDSYYVVMSNGVYSTRDKKVITGVADETQYGLVDGEFSDARFGYPINVVLLRSGLLAVTDYSNDRVRIVDVVGETVETLCPKSVSDTDNDRSCVISKPISLSVDSNSTKLYVGTSSGQLIGFGGTTCFSFIDLRWSPVNLCYGLYQSGEADISINGVSMRVWCDLDAPGGPWITLLTRYDGSEDFNRTYLEYSQGFGDLSGEHWLGLEQMHQLTRNGTARLRMDIEGFAGKVRKSVPINAYAEYDKFVIGDATSGYVLEVIDGYTGTAGDMETTDDRANLGGPHKGMKFSTKDKDEDAELLSCAGAYNGGWWFSHCYTVCLTCGPYYDKAKNGVGAAMIYYPYTLRKTSLKSASMKIRLPESALWEN